MGFISFHRRGARRWRWTSSPISTNAYRGPSTCRRRPKPSDTHGSLPAFTAWAGCLVPQGDGWSPCQRQRRLGTMWVSSEGRSMGNGTNGSTPGVCGSRSPGLEPDSRPEPDDLACDDHWSGHSELGKPAPYGGIEGDHYQLLYRQQALVRRGQLVETDPGCHAKNRLRR